MLFWMAQRFCQSSPLVVVYVQIFVVLSPSEGTVQSWGLLWFSFFRFFSNVKDGSLGKSPHSASHPSSKVGKPGRNKGSNSFPPPARGGLLVAKVDMMAGCWCRSLDDRELSQIAAFSLVVC